jgi:hypothetical protein
MKIIDAKIILYFLSVDRAGEIKKKLQTCLGEDLPKDKILMKESWTKDNSL